MKKFTMITEKVKRKMLAFKKAIINEKDRKTFKAALVAKIQKNVQKFSWCGEEVILRWDRAEKLKRVIDEIIFKASDRGFSFNGRETLAELCDCDITTVDKAIKLLKESGEVVFAYGRNSATNGFKTPIAFIKSHPNFKYWENLCHLSNEEKKNIEEIFKLEEKINESKKEEDEENKRIFFEMFSELEELNLTTDQIRARRMIANCPFLDNQFKEKSKRIASLLPGKFTELDYVVLTDTIKAIDTKHVKSTVKYFVKAFYKNKLQEAERTDIELNVNDVPSDLLPQKMKDKARFEQLRNNLVKYQREGKTPMVEAIQWQIDRLKERMMKNNCYV